MRVPITPNASQLLPDIPELSTAFPSLALALSSARSKLPFPSDYTPEVVEIFFDEFPVYAWSNGVTTLELTVADSLEPFVIEIAIDGELAFVLIDNQIVLNRLNSLAFSDI